MKAKKPYKKRRKRVGRGAGSGRGGSSGRGDKGQMSRSGARRSPGFEGGQMPFIRRIPKRGFNNPFKKKFQIVNLDTLTKLKAKEITPEKLLEEGIVRNLYDGLKVLGRGEIKKSLVVQAHRFSNSAREKIEKAGGQAIVIGQVKASAEEETKEAKKG